MKERFSPPVFREAQFHCPHCGVFSSQVWKGVYEQGDNQGITRCHNLLFAMCVHCGERTIWKEGVLIEPTTSGVELANEDILPEILYDYHEAAEIVNRSPRGAAALLRLAIQKLCIQLGEKGKKIDDDIASLVKKGLSTKIQQALDIVRVIGNESVHPGQIDLKDDRETALKLFRLINLVAEVMISEPKRIDEMYNSMPENKLKGIAARDNTDTKTS